MKLREGTMSWRGGHGDESCSIKSITSASAVISHWKANPFFKILAEPIVRAELPNLPDGSIFIYCQVGPRD